MTVHHSPHAPVSAVVAPGLPPYQAPWDIELRGPLDAAGLERLLGELAAAHPDRTGWQHRLLRHGPDHHTLRVCAPDGAPAAFLAGRIADRLTEPAAGTDCVLTPAQHAILAWRGGHRYEAVLIEMRPGSGGAGSGAGRGLGGDVDVDALRGALRAVVAAHPQLRSRLDETGGRRAGRGGRRRTKETEDGRRTQRSEGRRAAGAGEPAAAEARDPLTEGAFTDEAGFAALVESAARTLDPYAGIQLRALLARDRRPGVPRTDRLVVIAHELAVDAASWRVLLEDLTTALATRRPPVRQRHRSVPDGLADWAAELRELARDAAEAQHWSAVAERRGKTYGTPAPEEEPARDEARSVAPAPDGGADGTVHPRVGFALEAGVTERILHGLARRLALTTGQVLTGVFALALARWQGSEEAGFDVYGDPRAERPGLRRRTGRLTGSYPVQVTVDRGRPDALGRLTALAGQLAGCAGRAAGGAGFWACREWSPDPALRRTLRDLAPASVRLTLGDPGGPLPGDARPVPVGPVPAGAAAGEPLPGTSPPDGTPGGDLLSGGTLPGGAPERAAYRVEARAYVRDRRLHIGLDRADGTAGPSAAALVALVRELLQELAAAPAAPLLPAFRATPQQVALYRGGDARPGTGRHVEQLVWVWHGPLDHGRFTASWQSVFDCETVLRTAFTEGAEPLLLVHDRVVPEITRRADPDDWPAFLERDRLRGFDLRRPGALRLTLAEAEQPAGEAAGPGKAGPPPSTRIVVTYHRALLDNWSAHLLLREFYRAYLAGGTLPGGERRPDLRDYTAWAAAQDLEPARGFWTGGAPAEPAAPWPGPFAGRSGARGGEEPGDGVPGGSAPSGGRTAGGRPAGGGSADGGPAAAGRSGAGRAGAARPRAGRAGPTGVGRVRLSLDSLETTRLAHWAADLGTAESSVLQAVCAMLVYRASGATGPAQVSFAVTVSGRGIALDGVARMPGPLRNPLPMTVEVNPADTVPRLLRRLRDRALDMAAYEWVPADLARTWSRAGADTGTHTNTLIVFEDPPHPLEGMEAQLAAHGIHAELPDTVPARSVLPIGLLAHHDSTGGLVLTGVHDRALLDEEEAAGLLAQSGLLLRSLPTAADETTTVGDVLALLDDGDDGRDGDGDADGGRGALPRRRTAGARGAAADRAGGPYGGPDRPGGPLATLRAARHARAGRICLIPPPDTPGSCYDELAREYPGPQELLVLTAPPDDEGAEPALAALRSDGSGTPLLLAGFSGAGVLACDVARRVSALGGSAPRVVLAGASADERERTRDLVRALENAVPRH